MTGMRTALQRRREVTEQVGSAASRRAAERNSRRGDRGYRTRIFAAQVVVAAVALLLWQYIPQIHFFRRIGHIFDPFFVSSPSRVANHLWQILYANHTMRGFVWTDIRQTLTASIIGLVIGLVLGAGAGLAIGNSRVLSDIFRPFLVAVNATPRIAFIPIVAIIFGLGLTSSVINAVLVVFFVAFFNAYEGAVSVPAQLVDNARVFGSGSFSIMRHIRFPYVVGWTFATLPVSAALSILAVVTGEILIGNSGLGGLIAQAQTTADSTQTFSVVVLLAVMGLLLVTAADAIKRRVLHWWAR